MSHATRPYSMLIDGKLVSGTAVLEVIDPATEEVFAKAPDCTSGELEEAISSARRAFPAWRDLGIEQRRTLLSQVAPRFEQHVDEFARLLTREQGKPLTSAVREFESLLRFIKGVCQQAIPETVNEDTPTRCSVTRYIPLGVVAPLPH